MQPHRALILFDLDGTLVETAPEMTDAVNLTLQRFSLPAVTQPQVERWIGHGTRELLVQATACASQASPSEVRANANLARMAEQFDQHYFECAGTRSQLYPQVREALQSLRAAGTRLAVVTNKEARFTQRVLEAHRLTLLFDQVIAGDTLPTRKPDPQGVLHCLARFGVTAQQALFVGDSSIDVATARNAGVEVWALPYGYNMGQPIAASAPDRVIEDVGALVARRQG